MPGFVSRSTTRRSPITRRLSGSIRGTPGGVHSSCHRLDREAGIRQSDRRSLHSHRYRTQECPRLQPAGTGSFRQEGHDKAISDFNEAIRLDPDNPFTFGSRGFAWFRKREYDKAVADFTEEIRLDPTSAIAIRSRGVALSELRKYDEAIADLTEGLRLEPEDAPAYLCRGGIWSHKRQYGEAIADFSDAIRIEPASPDAYRACAWIWATCPDKDYRDGKKAVESATKACELTAWKVAIDLATLAAACAEVGDFASAVKWQTNANVLPAVGEDTTIGTLRSSSIRKRGPTATPRLDER